MKGAKVSKYWYRLYLNINSTTSTKKQVKFDVNDNKALIPLNIKHQILNGLFFFDTLNSAREYLFLNYLIQKQIQVLSELFDNCLQVEEESFSNKFTFHPLRTLTIIERNYTLKENMIPHYVIYYYSQDTIIFYSVDEDGNGSTDKKHWAAIPTLRVVKKNKRVKTK